MLSVDNSVKQDDQFVPLNPMLFIFIIYPINLKLSKYE